MERYNGLMRHPKVLILGYSEAGMFLRKPDAVDVRAVISIHGQREHPIESQGISHRLVLNFDDTEAPSPTDLIHASRIRLRQRQAAEYGLKLTPPTIEHAQSIINFAESIRELDGTLLCQCLGGISRSPAAALICLAAWTGPGHESKCVRQLMACRPSAIPHLDLVKFGDDLLHRKGSLTKALRRHVRY